MKIVRYQDGANTHWGIVEGNVLRQMEGDPFGHFRPSAKTKRIEDVRLLSPCLPSKIVAVGLNYRDHAEEMKLALPSEPLLFLKPSTSVIGPDEPIVYPTSVDRVDYEAELAVVMRKVAKAVSAEAAADTILGYTCLNDVTARNLQKKDGQWTRSKGFDTFAPMGPWIETEIDPSHLEISSYLNGTRQQHSNTTQLIFSPLQLVSFISHIMTLLPGDVIATGTPSGIGPMAVGDRIDVVIDGIGTLSNTIVASGA
ncbi:MAG: fumarylacetoacetate hydrolase family protein [Deltaproteobacteria bacterium]|jgi:2-keto-4-pentenoate hydratase/2-oxohepta-3-ene-1,7-dioic acid hydratase in catechol pathway|nr:fumarylacetoacetate hydrolase family protein [Deltaproteobacteria bacterium]